MTMLHPAYVPPPAPAAAAARSASPPRRSQSPPPPTSAAVRRALPDRVVTAATIDDAFVSFILYCNPGVPVYANTASLRENFQAPPKSGGKTFSTYNLYELIRKLDTKELKTWAELALKLGVDPPDPEKGESSQKIQQYAVRLKRWMHSMHVDAFFDYLLQRPSSYWTDLPSESDPINESERDGVAAEDDMALRALMPQLKPRRGKRKGGEDESLMDDASARPDGPVGEPWSAQPDGRGNGYFFPPSGLTPAMAQPPVAPWTNSDIVQTPLTAYPHSAITPSTRNAFWTDPSEPRSAITPSKGRSAARRHGAKVVSSAWRSGASSTGKTRGRPPNRGNNPDGPFSAFPTSEPQGFNVPDSAIEPNGEPDSAIPRSAIPASATIPIPHSAMTPSVLTPSVLTPNVLTPTVLFQPAIPPRSIPPPDAPVPMSGPPPPPSPSPISTPTTPGVPSRSITLPSPTDRNAASRPAKRSRLSLQVPERVGGEVRLATPPPPPVVVVNGEIAAPEMQPPPQILAPPGAARSDMTSIPAMLSQTWNPQAKAQAAAAAGHPPAVSPPMGSSSDGGSTPPHQALRFQDPTDRTNLDDLEVYFVHEILNGTWTDANGNSIPPCGIDEAWAIATTIIENVLKAAASKEAFLINMAALAGGKSLHGANFLRITRYDDADRNRYTCHWELRLGDIRGLFSMQETVLHERWKKPPLPQADEIEAADRAREEAGGEPGQGSNMTETDWRRKYQDLMALVRAKDEQLYTLRSKIMESLRDPLKRKGMDADP